jgi:hypothetical protein
VGWVLEGSVMGVTFLENVWMWEVVQIRDDWVV